MKPKHNVTWIEDAWLCGCGYTTDVDTSALRHYSGVRDYEGTVEGVTERGMADD